MQADADLKENMLNDDDLTMMDSTVRDTVARPTNIDDSVLQKRSSNEAGA